MNIFSSRCLNPAPNTAPLSSRLAGILSIAFLRMVSMNGNTCRLMVSTSPPNEKNPSEMLPLPGNSCWNSPFFCIKRIHPMEAM